MKAPDKGSFPLDHFQECNQLVLDYQQCLQKHQLMPKRCRDIQVDYLQCRMQKGLMQQEDLQKLGITKETSYQSEEQEKKALFEEMIELKREAALEILRNKQFYQNLNPKTYIGQAPDNPPEAD